VTTEEYKWMESEGVGVVGEVGGVHCDAAVVVGVVGLCVELGME
jgi:hypothetical protein